MKLVENFAAVGEALNKGVQKFTSSLENACMAAARKTRTGLLGDLRAQVGANFKSNKLPNTWQGKVYPGTGKSLNAAVYVFSKAPKIMLAFDQGVTIKSKNGWYLAVPTQNCPKSYLGKRVTPANWPKETYGPLEFIYSKGTGHSFLAATNPPGKYQVKRDRSLRGGARKVDLAHAIMFILLPQVTLAKKLDVEGAADKWLSEFARLVPESMEK